MSVSYADSVATWEDTLDYHELVKSLARTQAGIKKAKRNKEDPAKIASAMEEALFLQDDIARLQAKGAGELTDC